PSKDRAEFESEKSDHKQKTPKTGIKKQQPHPTNGKTRGMVKKQQTKTTKHTIEFSNNTPGLTAQQTRG
ncbi:hypothetical protein, partial [Mycolicibacterium sp. CBMA 360]|uniref:hypothetical protein n=1 Tax=Mycolicibacterium sp. CBMA 360 TaxID=2606614 RepID=UPI00193D08E2